MFKVNDLTDSINLLVQQHAANVAKKRTLAMRDSIRAGIRAWRVEVRELLSVRYTGGVNTTLFPKFRPDREGMSASRRIHLRDSVPTYRLDTRVDFNGFKIGKNQVVIHMKQNKTKPPWYSYGEELEHWGTQLGGWKTRAYALLDDRIRRNIYTTGEFTKTVKEKPMKWPTK